MKSLISDAFAFGLRLQRCSSAQLASRGAELVALGNRLEDAWKAGNMADLRSLRSELCHLARRIGGELERAVGVTFASVAKSREIGWVLIFSSAEVNPVPLRPEQFEWMAESACAA